jgi:hypothetical protein
MIIFLSITILLSIALTIVVMKMYEAQLNRKSEKALLDITIMGIKDRLSSIENYLVTLDQYKTRVDALVVKNGFKL